MHPRPLPARRAEVLSSFSRVKILWPPMVKQLFKVRAARCSAAEAIRGGTGADGA